MRKSILIIIVLINSTISAQEIKDKIELSTKEYGGTYFLSSTNEINKKGMLLVYPESDSTMLFYVELSTGEPLYIFSSIYGRIKKNIKSIKSNQEFDFIDYKCNWTIKFLNDSVIIKTKNENSCGIGQEYLMPEGNYKRHSGKIPESFEDEASFRVEFKSIKPEDYNGY